MFKSGLTVTKRSFPAAIFPAAIFGRGLGLAPKLWSSMAMAICAAALVGLPGSSNCMAQEAATYKVIPTNAKFRDVSTEGLKGDAARAARKSNGEARTARNEARAATKNGIKSGNMAPVKDYFNGYIFPRMTQPEELESSGALRDSFFRTYMKSDLSEANRKRVIADVIMPAMKAIAVGKDYSPAARLNAVAMIGRLDDSSMQRNGTRVTPPKPSTLAFGFLSGLLNDATVPAWLKAASVQSLIRHLSIDAAVNRRFLNADQRNVLETFAINTLDDKAPGQDQWKPDLNYWLKRRAVQLLGAIGRPGQGGVVLERLIKAASDDQQTVWLQLDAVKSLRAIDYSGVDTALVSKVMLTVTEFLQRQLTAQASSIDKQLKELIYKNILYNDVDFEANGSFYERNVAKSSGMGMGMMGRSDMEMDMMGMGGTGTKLVEPAILVELPTYQLNLIRRRMKIFAFTANDVLNSSKNITAAASPKDKQLQLAIKQFTNKFMKDSSIGVIDASKELDFDDMDEMQLQTESYTDQLRDVCSDGASSIQTILTRYAGGAAGAAPGVPDAPGGNAGDTPEKSDDPFGVN